MQTTAGFTGLDCLDCSATADAETTTHRCPECGGALTPSYDAAHRARLHEDLDSGDVSADLLPFESAALTTLGEGMTPTIDCPNLADSAGVERVLLKDESRSPTGAVVDRGIALAVTAASQHGATDVALPTTGNGGQAAAAYAARAGLASHSFVPSRSTFANKAMINVHGGDMNVVGGRYPDAVSAFESHGEDWYSLAPFETPYRHEGQKMIAYELFARLETLPDAIVHPTAHGTVLVGLYRGFLELQQTGFLDSVPRLYAAQPEGCAPIVSADEAGETEPTAVQQPDTISGPLEVPEPAGGRYVLEAIAATDGGAVSVTDDELLEAAVSAAGDGVPASATGGVAIQGLQTLADRGEFDADDQLLVINPTTANRESDILRSHLMKQGI